MSDLSNPHNLQWLLSGNTADNGHYRAVAQQRRGEKSELEDLFYSIYQANTSVDATANTEAIAGHTVESMVAELRDRVQLDVIHKKAEMFSAEVPLFVKAEDKNNSNKILNEMRDFIVRHYVRPGRGQSSIPALFEALKENFEIDGISAAGGMEKVKQMLENVRKEHVEANPADDLPTYDGTPLSMGREQDEGKDRSDFLTQDAPKNT